MPDTSVQGIVPLKPKEAFDIYVNKMNTWWPRQGVFPYSFAPNTTWPQLIRFEPKLGGRYYETFADDTEYVIGHITAWRPSEYIEYTWRDPNWKSETNIKVTFTSIDNGTEVTCEQDGFASAGVPELIPYYQIGNRQTLAGFLAHCQAVFEMKEQGLNLA